MSHEVSHSPVDLDGLEEPRQRRVKDSLLLIVVFITGLLGTCYILHFALSNESTSTGYHIDNSDVDHYAESEVIYITEAQ